VYRLRQGETDRRIARDLGMSRHTVSKYRQLAEEGGYLGNAAALPTEKELLARLGPDKAPPRTESTVAPYVEVVERLLSEGVEMAAMFARLRDDHGYRGSYSSVRRFIHQLQPNKPEVSTRVHSGPGEEAQVDFGPVGKLLDATEGVLKASYAFVMTLCFSRHQYAELVFDQKISTWIGCHRRAFETFGGYMRNGQGRVLGLLWVSVSSDVTSRRFDLSTSPSTSTIRCRTLLPEGLSCSGASRS